MVIDPCQSRPGVRFQFAHQLGITGPALGLIE